jgi:hypothetical protein
MRHVVRVLDAADAQRVSNWPAAPESCLVAEPHPEREVEADRAVGQPAPECVPHTGCERRIK